MLHDPLILLKEKEAHYITYSNYKNKLYIIENKVKPIIANGKVLGIFIDSNSTHELSKVDFNIISSLKNNKIINLKTQKNSSSDINIKFIEDIITFLLVIGFPDKEIANILCQVGKCISHHAISKIITRNLFSKFNVTSRVQLIKKLYSLGFHKSLPQCLIHNVDALQVISSVLSQS